MESDTRIAMIEVWKPISGWPGYEVSNTGKVRSLPRIVLLRYKDGRVVERFTRGRTLRPAYSHGKYAHVNLCKDGIVTSQNIHSLVAEAFCDKPVTDLRLEVCHNNGDTKDNRAINLRWDTSKGNASDRIRHGTSGAGAKNARAKLTAEDVAAIRISLKTNTEIAKAYNITACNVRLIRARKSWRSLP